MKTVKPIVLGETNNSIPAFVRSSGSRKTVVCTIAFHPEAERIGEEYEFGGGRAWATRLSRAEGEFTAPARSGERASDGLALATSQVSRDR